jgi:hypothetical protein
VPRSPSGLRGTRLFSGHWLVGEGGNAKRSRPDGSEPLRGSSVPLWAILESNQ